jgi:hypothetical protein
MHKIVIGRSEGKRSIQIRGYRWEDNIKNVGLEGEEWVHLG